MKMRGLTHKKQRVLIGLTNFFKFQQCTSGTLASSSCFAKCTFVLQTYPHVTACLKAIAMSGQ
jgi:hypothetical protein